jgi:hypothetical protein
MDYLCPSLSTKIKDTKSFEAADIKTASEELEMLLLIHHSSWK